MRRVLYAIPGLLILAGMGWWDYATFVVTGISNLDPVMFVLVGGGSLVLLMLGLWLVALACTANVYRVLNGEVINVRWGSGIVREPSSWLFFGASNGFAAVRVPGDVYIQKWGHALRIRREDGRTAWVRVNPYFFEKTHRGDYVDLRRGATRNRISRY